MQQSKIINGDCIEILKTIENETVDAIVTDPPYLYLKNQKLERQFDEMFFFQECARILKKTGFIVCFGRGESFYRWNTIMSQVGLVFKEEIVWDKSYISSPLMAISRVHETISVYGRSNAVIRKRKIPYTEARANNLEEIHRDLKRIKTIISNKTAFSNLEKFLNYGEMSFDGGYEDSTTISSKNNKRICRVVSTTQAVIHGMNEKSIIKVQREHYNSIHPTQKPVRLLERLISLVTDEGGLVIDPFCGSGSTIIAAKNINRVGIGIEIDEEYYSSAKNRLDTSYPVGGQGLLL